MMSSGIFNLLLGTIFTFLPQETALFIGDDITDGANLIIYQLSGAALLGIGLLNYMGRGMILGGIYGKPLLLGNLVYHLTAGITCIRFAMTAESWHLYAIAVMTYTLISFGFIKLNITPAG